MPEELAAFVRGIIERELQQENIWEEKKLGCH